MDKREQAKQDALAKFVETYHSNDEQYPILEKVALLEGFDAGHAAADDWVAIEDGPLATQAEIDEHDCPYNLHIGGAVGINNPLTSAPWTHCDRLSAASCTARGVDPKYHLSHATMTASVQNNQSNGPNLTSTSEGNENNLKDPGNGVTMDKREQAKQDALAKFVETYHSNDEQYPILEKVALLEGFDAGHAAADDWVAIEDGLPPREPNKSYSNPPCLVTLKGEVRILCFNHEHLVWDDETGDDFYCQIGDVTAWKPLPKPYQRPNDEEKNK